MTNIDLKIKLDEEQFRCLVSGGILTVNDGDLKIMICLSDIGFHRMDKAIEDADSGELPAYSNMEIDLS